MARESEVRQLYEALRAERQRLDCSSGDEGSIKDDVENERPKGAAPAAIRRVASRPSLVPRRPLDQDRRASNASMLPLPRVNSATSLMSLDMDTPVKSKSSTSSSSSSGDMRRRLASKSMHDLGAAAAAQSGSAATPSRGVRSSAEPMPLPFGRRSESSATSPRRRAQSTAAADTSPLLQLPHVPQSRSAEPSPVTTSGFSFSKPTPPYRTSTAPVALTLHDDDDIPSPFIKKIEHGKFASSSNLAALAARGQQQATGLPTSTSSSSVRTVPTRASRISLGSGARTKLSDRLLATRAQAQAGFQEVSKRVSSQIQRPKSAMTA